MSAAASRSDRSFGTDRSPRPTPSPVVNQASREDEVPHPGFEVVLDDRNEVREHHPMLGTFLSPGPSAAQQSRSTAVYGSPRFSSRSAISIATELFPVPKSPVMRTARGSP